LSACGACITNNDGQHIGRSRGGLTSKIHVVVDGNGLPVRLGLTGGQVHDNRLCSVLLQQLPRHARLLADRGYDADWIRAFVLERGAWANIPPKRNRTNPICFSPYLYRDRNLVERFFNKIKHCRRVATRYDKLAANYLAFVKLACIRLWLRVYECTALVNSRFVMKRCFARVLTEDPLEHGRKNYPCKEDDTYATRNVPASRAKPTGSPRIPQPNRRASTIV
jgi:transposase